MHSRLVLKDHHKIWSPKTGGLWWQVQLKLKHIKDLLPVVIVELFIHTLKVKSQW